MFSDYRFILLLTIAIEGGVIWLLTRKERSPGECRDYLILALVLNLITHPIATMLVALERASWTEVEIAVVVVEMIGYRYFSSADWRRAFWLSFLSNLVTASLSFVL